MYDASAKLSSGVLSGNVNNYGDLDECLSINQPMHSITGRHCGVRIQPFVTNATSTPYIAFLHRLAQSFELMRTQLKDVSLSAVIITYFVCTYEISIRLTFADVNFHLSHLSLFLIHPIFHFVNIFYSSNTHDLT